MSNHVQSNDKSNCKIRYRYKKNVTSLQSSKKKSNAVINKITKKVTSNCNSITSNKLLPFPGNCGQMLIEIVTYRTRTETDRIPIRNRGQMQVNCDYVQDADSNGFITANADFLFANCVCR